jgi:hypothetical protein
VVGDAVIQPMSTLRPDQHFMRAAGSLSDEQFRSIERIARDPVARKRTMLVAQHHAPLGCALPVLNWFDGMERTAAFRALLTEHQDLHVVHGHTHVESTTSIADRPHAQVFSVPSCRDGARVRIYRAEDRRLHVEAPAGPDQPEAVSIPVVESLGGLSSAVA